MESLGQPLRNELTTVEPTRCFNLSIGHLVPLWLVRTSFGFPLRCYQLTIPSQANETV